MFFERVGYRVLFSTHVVIYNGDLFFTYYVGMLIFLKNIKPNIHYYDPK